MSLLTDRYAEATDRAGEDLNDLLNEWNDEHHVPDQFVNVVSTAIKEL